MTIRRAAATAAPRIAPAAARRTAAIAVFAVAFTFAALPPVDAQETGSFEATVEIDGTPHTLTGFCVSSGQGSGWYTQMVTPGGGSTIMLVHTGGNPPATGEYPIADFVQRDANPRNGEFLATGSVDPQLFIVSGFTSLSGLVVITASSATSVSGTFSCTARAAVEGGGSASVRGTFESAAKEN